MAKHFKKISISFTLSCLLLNLGYGSTPCQNGYDYNNKCDPYYNVNLIQAKVSNDRNRVARRVPSSTVSSTTISHKVATKPSSSQRQSDLSYLDTLRSRYSSQFNGRMGLQALIDRSKYINLKKIEKIETSETSKNNIDKKIVKKDLVKAVEHKSKAKHVTTKEIAAKTKTPKHISSKPVVKREKIGKSKHIASKTTTVKKTKQKVAKTATSPLKIKLYTVKVGDNLIKIAKKFSVSKSSILSLNKLDKNATIKVGQKLTLPTAIKNRVKIAKVKVKKIKKSTPKGIYIVKSGDTLSSIAAKKKISLVKLREINRLSRSGKIRLGQKLMLIASRGKKRTAKNYDIVKNLKFRKTPSLKYKRKIRVVATAYTSHVGQTDKTPFLAAWNNRIRPGMKIIAVSPDLIRKYGLTNGVKVKILGLPGYYVIRDKMNARLRNHIDIYMGVNKHRALQWGRKRIVLYW